MITVQLLLVLVFLVSSNRVVSKRPHHDIDDKLTADREAAFYCYKQKTCTHGGPKVCGYDPLISWLAVFEDLCTLYKANCLKSGRFRLIPQIVCDTKLQYDKEHVNETFEFDNSKVYKRNSSTIARRATSSTLGRFKVQLVGDLQK